MLRWFFVRPPREYFIILLVIIDAEWHFLKGCIKWHTWLLWRLLSHVIAVDRVLLNCFCTKMEFMLRRNAVTTQESLYACVKVTGQKFWLGYNGFTVCGPNNHGKVLRTVFFLPCWLPWFVQYFICSPPTTTTKPTFMSFLLCNMLNMTLQTHNPVFTVKLYSIHIVCASVCEFEHVCVFLLTTPLSYSLHVLVPCFLTLWELYN